MLPNTFSEHDMFSQIPAIRFLRFSGPIVQSGRSYKKVVANRD
jgi:hypothetical protein